MVVRVVDSFGNVAHSEQIRRNNTGRGLVDFARENARPIYAGDTLAVEVEVDPSFGAGTFVVSWTGRNVLNAIGPRLCVGLTKGDVRTDFAVTCKVTSNREWHRCGDCDDAVTMQYRVLPPA